MRFVLCEAENIDLGKILEIADSLSSKVGVMN